VKLKVAVHADEMARIREIGFISETPPERLRQ